MKLSSDIVSTMTVSDEVNEVAKVQQPSSVQDPGVRAQPNRNDTIIVCDVTDKDHPTA